MDNKPKIIILCGPSGAGKSTIRKKLLEIIKPHLHIIKTYTTRSPRNSDHPSAYSYIHKDEFLQMLKNKKFIEFNLYNGHYYATNIDDLKKIISKKQMAIKEMDINTARKIKKLYPQSVTIFFIDTPIENLRQRLIKRKENTSSEIETRLKVAKQEIKMSQYADYIVRNPENFPENAALEIASIIKNDHI